MRVRRVLQYFDHGLLAAVNRNVGVQSGSHRLPHQQVQPDFLPGSAAGSQAEHPLKDAVGAAEIAPDVVHVGAKFVADLLDFPVVPIIAIESLHQFIQQFGGAIAKVGNEVQRVSDLMCHPGGKVDHLAQFLLGHDLVLRFPELGQGQVQFLVPSFQDGVGVGQLVAEFLHELQPDDLDGTQPQRFKRLARLGHFVVAAGLDIVLEVAPSKSPDPGLDCYCPDAHPHHQHRLDHDYGPGQSRQGDQRRVSPKYRGDEQGYQQDVGHHDQEEMLHRVTPEAEARHPKGVITLNQLLGRGL